MINLHSNLIPLPPDSDSDQSDELGGAGGGSWWVPLPLPHLYFFAWPILILGARGLSGRNCKLD